MKKTNQEKHFRGYLMQLYAGMFSGMLVLCALASCAGIASNSLELAYVVLPCLASSVLFFTVDRLLNK